MIPLLSKNKHFQGEEETLFWGKGWTTIHFSFSKTYEALGNYLKISAPHRMEIDRVKTPGRSWPDCLKCSHFHVKHLAISGKYFVILSFSRCCQSTVITMTHWSCTKKRIKQGHFEPIQKEMKHGKKTHYFYQCFVSCSNCNVRVRQLHAPDRASSKFLGASPLHLTASHGSSQGLATPGEAQHSKDWNGCLNLHLESSSHPFHGKKLLLFPCFYVPCWNQRCQSVVVSFPPLQGRAFQGSLQWHLAWVTTLQLLGPEALSKSSVILARKHLNLR